ncbi:hypothetical protein T10_1590 [Trichinella papuae]|uniref:Uncharacterized protein n=1 Tax=Trichinella papuae TaxID=268474 RepID=A0A0V1MY72_9BILA|nr:hypothetical protein T10_1590 [Trichinella papuae]
MKPGLLDCCVQKMFNRTTADGCTLVHGAELVREDRFENSSSEARFIFQHSIHFQLGMMVQNEGNCICQFFFLRIRRRNCKKDLENLPMSTLRTPGYQGRKMRKCTYSQLYRIRSANKKEPRKK